MKIRVSLLLFLILVLTACAKREKNKTPIIDQSLIKVDNLIWNLDALQEVPPFKYLDSTSKVREIMFKGVDHQGKETQVLAYYSNPDILKTGTNLGNKFPGVVLISGGDQPAFKEWVERWAHEGYAAITCDYGNTRMSEAGGPVFRNLEEQLRGIYDAIEQGPKAVRSYRTAASAILAHSLLLSFPEVKKNKTAVTGISWGGFQTCIVSGIDNRFKAATSVYGSAFHDEIALDKNHFSKLDSTYRALWMDKIDPKNYIIYSQCPTLFINGNTDGCFDIVPFDKTTKLIPEKNRYVKITPNMEHDHPIAWESKEIAAFFNSIFKDGTPLAKITGTNKHDSIIKFNYESTVTLKQAKFYYSNDTININEKRIWQSIPAKIFDDIIESPVPEEGYLLGFLYVEDIMNLGISSELLIN
ncbi:alpha/beta hydrolase family protein [Flavivirga spongiicola]|uniref:Dienelactone hydrolase family protein n=1 Tax=Flavivirga spongiicola TaxID=421621 RepID=A0ABU7XNM8_9FLAO|nr:dienelactone hydrolase family protein [Flavivirga sp. MEBiC05379]MDO5977377.1 dienelactone hydrolase family protein [Flavivirga sp. MEBiC05379]